MWSRNIRLRSRCASGPSLVIVAKTSLALGLTGLSTAVPAAEMKRLALATEFLYSVFCPARRGRLRRHSDGGAGCGACGVTCNHAPGGKGHRPLQLRGAAFDGWTRHGDGRRKPPGNNRAKASVRRGHRSIRARKYGPEAKNRRVWSAERRRAAAGSRKPACPARPSQMSLHGLASMTAAGICTAPFGAPPPRILGERRQAHPSPDQNTGR